MASSINKTQDQYVYFLYSEEQKNERNKVESKMSRSFIPGNVIVNGRKKFFTEISKTPSNRYPDCKVVAEGLKSKFIITPISFR